MYKHVNNKFSSVSQSPMSITLLFNENYDIARAMSSSRADPVLGHCPNWGYLNI